MIKPILVFLALWLAGCKVTPGDCKAACRQANAQIYVANNCTKAPLGEFLACECQCQGAF